MTRSRVTISIPSELLEWMDNHVEEKYEYRDRSHFIEVLISRYREKVEAKQ